MEKVEKYSHIVGELVVYKKQGIYEITGIKQQEIGNVQKDYYVLSSVYDKNATVYVPADSEALALQIEHMLSKDEIHTIIDRSKDEAIEWIENNTERAISFDEIIKNGDLSKILSVLKLYILQKECNDKKTYRTFARDERVFSAAMKAVTEAFAYPLGLEKTEVIPYITERIKNN